MSGGERRQAGQPASIIPARLEQHRCPGQVSLPQHLQQGLHVGSAVLSGHPRVEIGWQLDKAVWGQGLAPEGARAWLDYGWNMLKLEEIVAFTAAINLPSQRVMEKIGMSREASDDFDHPALAPGHSLLKHVLYRIKAPRH